MKYLAALLFTATTTLAQLPAPTPDVRVVENNGDYGPRIPGIWGNKVVNPSGPFPVNDGFLVTAVPRDTVPTSRRAPFAWNERGDSRIMGFRLNLVNIGGAALNFGNAWTHPTNYVETGWYAPAINDLFTITLTDSNQVAVHTFGVDAILPWYNGRAVGPPSTEFRPYWQGLSAGAAAVVPEPMLNFYWVDTSHVIDGEYRMTIRVRGGGTTTRKVRIESLEVRVIGL